MRLGKTMLMAGTAYLALTAPGFSQSATNASPTWATCMDVRDELRREVQSMDDRGSWMNRVDNLISQARDSRTPADCLRTLQEANRIVGRETGDAPISAQRFQTAQQGGSSGRTSDRSSATGSQGDRSGGTSAQSRDGADVALMDSDALRVPVAFAHSIVGVSVTDSNGDPAGEIEYLVIDTDTSEIKFAVLGSGGMLDMGEEYTAVPWEQLNVGLDAGRPYAEITATVDKLKEGRRLRYDTLNQLTSMEYQTRVIDYWIPTSGSHQDHSQRDRSSSNSDRGQMQSGTSERAMGSGQQGSDDYIDFRERAGLSGEMDRRQRQASGTGDRGTSSGQQGRQDYTDFRERRGLSSGSGQPTGSDMDRQRQAQSDTWSGTQSGDSSRDSMSADRRTSDRYGQAASRYEQQGATQERQRQLSRDSSDDGSSLMLAGRQFITVLSPSSLKTGRQLRGAEVVSRDGQELGEIDRLVVDLDRGYIAYALVAQGGFLGIGEEWRPVPVAALRWRRGETYGLSQSSDELRSSPRLARAELPDRVRTADLRMLYQKYGVTPYWQQSQQQGDMPSSEQRSESRDRMQSGQQR